MGHRPVARGRILHPQTHLLAHGIAQPQPVGICGAEVVQDDHEDVQARGPRPLLVPLQCPRLEVEPLRFEVFCDGTPGTAILVPQTAECDRNGSRHDDHHFGRLSSRRPKWAQPLPQETTSVAGYVGGMQPIGPWLRSMRENRGVPATQIAKALGLTTTTFARYELGHRKVPYDLLEPWGEALGFRVELIARSLEDAPIAQDLTESQRALLDQVLTSAGALGDADADLIRAMVHRIAESRGGPT